MSKQDLFHETVIQISSSAEPDLISKEFSPKIFEYFTGFQSLNPVTRYLLKNPMPTFIKLNIWLPDCEADDRAANVYRMNQKALNMFDI